MWANRLTFRNLFPSSLPLSTPSLHPFFRILITYFPYSSSLFLCNPHLSVLITLQSRFFCISAACSLICLSFSYNSLIHCLHHLHLPCTLSIDSVMSSCVVHVPLAAMARFHGSVVAEWPCVGSANSVTHSTILGRYVQSNTLRLLSSNFIPFISFVFFTASRFVPGRSLPHFLPSFSLRLHLTSYCLSFFLCLLL